MAPLVGESLNLLLDSRGLADARLAEQHQARDVDEPIECNDLVDVSTVVRLRIHEEASSASEYAPSRAHQKRRQSWRRVVVPAVIPRSRTAGSGRSQARSGLAASGAPPCARASRRDYVAP